MPLLATQMKTQVFATRNNIGDIFGRKDPSKLLRGFKKYADENWNKFHPHTPYIKNEGVDTLYNIICFAFYLENKDLLEAGTRSIKFKQEYPRLKEAYTE